MARLHHRVLFPLLLVMGCSNGSTPAPPTEPTEPPDTPAEPTSEDTPSGEGPDLAAWPPDAPPGTEDPGPAPEDPGPAPDDPGPTPVDPGATPDDPGPTPEDPGPTPVDPGPVPEDPGVVPGDPGPAPEDPGPPSEPGWVVVQQEDFETIASIGTTAWSPDPVPDDGPFSDEGAWFTAQGISAPQAWRATELLGDGGWLTIESYTRTPDTPLSKLITVVDDPAGGSQVLKITSAEHSDATVVRPTVALPARYRVSLRVGYMSFGDGISPPNGYDGGESAGPWGIDDATGENGFYWLAILDHMPRPHNNVWIHHHRKVVIDSDNNVAAWTEIFDGDQFINSGHHPVMMFALDGDGPTDIRIGKPFLSYAGGQWQPSGTVRAADSYLDNTWYDVSIERFDDQFTLRVSGTFLYGGETTYEATIDAAQNCVWHYNRPGQAPAAPCVDESSLPGLPGLPQWAASMGWPDWFMFGDPHVNYYEGTVHYDDVTLELWQE